MNDATIDTLTTPAGTCGLAVEPWAKGEIYIVAGFKWLVQHPDIWVPILVKLLVLVAPLLA